MVETILNIVRTRLAHAIHRTGKQTDCAALTGLLCVLETRTAEALYFAESLARMDEEELLHFAKYFNWLDSPLHREDGTPRSVCDQAGVTNFGDNPAALTPEDPLFSANPSPRRFFPSGNITRE